uniref:DNA-directed RNA polymerase n=1 Tax=Tydemania expeditionis TaxID=325645 RepID=A0A0D6E1J4_TYDEX|nr:RNA polymerase beta subunit [Tydemania expeditionis]CEO91094.1 RNA polymerase beta subunit [Tydemania expeditionis]
MPIMYYYFIFYRFLFFLSDFLVFQRKSFNLFLNSKLGEEFQKIQPFSYPNNFNKNWKFSIHFLYKSIKFLKPILSLEESIVFSKTYCCHFYVPIQFWNSLNKNISLQWVFLGTLPLLTRRGHFIVNGIPRIILNQIVRRPGIYFHKEKNKMTSRLFYGEIISNRGPWIRVEIDNRKKISICYKRTKSIPLSHFLQKFSQKYIDYCLQENNIKKKKVFQNILKDIPLQNDAFPDRDLYLDLGSIGRSNLNKKLNLWLSTYTLTPLDLLAIAAHLDQLTRKFNLDLLDDIDNLKNRKLKTIGELLKNQIQRGLGRLQKLFLKKDRLKTTPPFSVLNHQPINSTLKEFFHSNQLSQYLDQSNPLAELTHKRRLSCLGSGGINRDTPGMDIRGIHITHYGRICPIETPEGKNAGLVNSLTLAATITDEGLLETPFLEVFKKHLQNQKKVNFFSAENQEFEKIILSSKLPKNQNVGILQLQIQNFSKCSMNAITLSIQTPQQFISIATSCIPFIEHDDANRGLMGSNMQRQALPLLTLEPPFVTTFNTFKILTDLRNIPSSPKSGLIIYISQQKIILYLPKNTKQLCFRKLNLTPKIQFMKFIQNFD